MNLCKGRGVRTYFGRIVVISFVLLSIIVSILLFSFSVKASNDKILHKYYDSYVIENGDTLWSIADKYATLDNLSKEQYIDEIKQINHMLDDSIVAGNCLVISYYSYD